MQYNYNILQLKLQLISYIIYLRIKNCDNLLYHLQKRAYTILGATLQKKGEKNEKA